MDLADGGDRRLVERLIDEAHFRGLDYAGLEPRHGRRGAGVLAAVRAEHQPGTTRTRSNPEELMLALCHREKLPKPQVNALIEGYEVDFCWPEQRLIVEVDHRASHSTPGAFEWDRKKDAHLTVAGWRVIRVTDVTLTGEPRPFARQLRALLS
jgi:very-short-patch-repair endonuclease